MVRVLGVERTSMSSNPSDLTPLDLQAYLANPARWEQATQSLQAVARAIVGDQASAEDIVQSAWVEAMQKPRGSMGMG